MIDHVAERRRRLTLRRLPALGAAALAVLVLGMVVGSRVESSSERTARAFGDAWERGDFEAMHGLLSRAARSRYTSAELRRGYRDAAATATATARGISIGRVLGEDDGRVRLPVVVHTRIFGPIRGEVRLLLDGERVEWAPELVFPGLRRGEALTRRSNPPRRAKIVSRDGETLAEGDGVGRHSPLGQEAASIAGRVEPQQTVAGRRHIYARGFPPSWPVGQNGLERVFEPRVAGRPGGVLHAGDRVLARARPRPARQTRTTVDSRLQRAAVAALAGRLGGVAVLDARTAEVRALAGIAISAPQPPGSTFKIITATAALEAHSVRASTRFPVETRAVIDGVELENANGESCGGSFQASFAHSCNSVFAPLGVKVGARRLVAAAERYGFNGRPTTIGELPSSIPPADEIRSPLELGSTAIGQGKVLATPLQLASVAQTVAARGVRMQPSLRPGEPRHPTRVTSRRVARTVERMMIDVVAYGTGMAAGLPTVKVAGKTGTAELEDTRGPKAGVEGVGGSDPSSTDAWFTAYAPVGRPRIAVAVLLVRAGAGGQTAAPVARAVLEAAL